MEWLYPRCELHAHRVGVGFAGVGLVPGAELWVELLGAEHPEPNRLTATLRLKLEERLDPSPVVTPGGRATSHVAQPSDQLDQLPGEEGRIGRRPSPWSVAHRHPDDEPVGVPP